MGAQNTRAREMWNLLVSYHAPDGDDTWGFTPRLGGKVMTLYMQERGDNGKLVLHRVVDCCGEELICREDTQICSICKRVYKRFLWEE